jgi:hypothetical protein
MYRRVRPSDSTHTIHDGLLFDGRDSSCSNFQDVNTMDLPEGHKAVLGFKIIGPNGVRYSYVNNTYKSGDDRDYSVYLPSGLWSDLGLEDPESDVIYLEPIKSLPVAKCITVRVSSGCDMQDILRDALEEALMYAVLIQKGQRPLDAIGIDAVIERVADGEDNEHAVMLSGREVELIILGSDSEAASVPLVRPPSGLEALVTEASACADAIASWNTEATALVAKADASASTAKADASASTAKADASASTAKADASASTAKADASAPTAKADASAYPFGIDVQTEPERFVGEGRVEVAEKPQLTREELRQQRLARLGQPNTSNGSSQNA